jgi:hypothetical protein
VVKNPLKYVSVEVLNFEELQALSRWLQINVLCQGAYRTFSADCSWNPRLVMTAFTLAVLGAIPCVAQETLNPGEVKQIAEEAMIYGFPAVAPAVSRAVAVADQLAGRPGPMVGVVDVGGAGVSGC